MTVHFPPGKNRMPSLSLVAGLLLASLASNGYSQPDSLFDCFPLSVGSQWEYKFTHFYQSDPNPTYYGITDTGTVTYRLLQKSEYPDSILWLCRQTRVLHRTVYDSWIVKLDSMVVDTTAFNLVELAADRHELFLQRAVHEQYSSDFGANLFNFGFVFWRNMPDSLKVYRYCPVDSTSTALFDFEWPRWTYPAIRRIELKMDIGAAFVRLQSMATGSAIWSSFQLLSYTRIAPPCDPYPLEVGNKWNYHITETQGVQFQDSSNVEITVIGDTLMPNGRVYAQLSRPDVLGALFVRSDSSFIYYYSPWDSSESRMYNFRGEPGARDTTHWGHYKGFMSILVEKGTTLLFDTVRSYWGYDLGGLTSYEVSLTDGLGITSAVDQGDGGYPSTDWWELRGAIIRGKVYGLVSAVAENESHPLTFELFQNYPNPFNPSTTIRYALPQRSHIELTVFNTLGQRVATLVSGEVEAGAHLVRFDASGLASGVYFYRLVQNGFVQSRSMLLVR